MAKPTRTTNRLHFEDLDPRRFEDLAHSLVYRFRRWEDIHHDGRVGSDAGADIRATERLEDGSVRHWSVQCKRYESFASADGRKAVDEADAGALVRPDVLLLVIGCDVSLKARTATEDHAASLGIGNIHFWTASKLEVMLQADHPDLLFTFFGISRARQERNAESNIKRNLGLKRKLQRVFPSGCGNPRIIIRSVDDESYPNAEEAPSGQISTWFRCEFGGHHHEGLEVVLRVEQVIVDRDEERWAFVDWSDPAVRRTWDLPSAINLSKYDIVKVYSIGQIPFTNIVEVDETGDEYYNDTHLFCRFFGNAGPYKAVVIRSIEGHNAYQPDQQFNFADR